MAQRKIDINAGYSVDKSSEETILKSIRSVEQAAADVSAQGEKGADIFAPMQQSAVETGKVIQQISKDFGVTIEQAAKSFAGMATVGGKTEQEILAGAEAFRQFQAEAAQSTKQVNELEKSTQSLAKTARNAGPSFMVGMTGFTMAMTGMQLQQLGKTSLTPIEKYTTAMTKTEQLSARWLQNQERIENSVVRIGRVMTSSLQGAFENLADAVEKVADFAEKNPDAIKAFSAMAVGTFAFGKVTSVAGNALSAASSALMLKALLANSGTVMGSLVGGAAAAGTAATGGTLATAGAGIVAALTSFTIAFGPLITAIAGLVVLLKSEFGKKGVTAGAQMLTTSAYAWGSMLGGPELAAKWGKSIGELTGAIQKADSATESASDAFGGLAEAQLQAYRDFLDAASDAESQYQAERAKITADYNKSQTRELEDYNRQVALARRDFDQQLAQNQADYNRQRSQTMADYYKSEAEAEADYYQQRSDTAAKYNKEVQRAEEDHQRELRKLQEEHNDKMSDLVGARDAYGIVKEMRDYERQRRNSEEDYQVDVSRRSEDYAQQLTENEQQFARERAQRMADFQQRLSDQATEFQTSRQQKIAQFEQQMKDAEEEFKIRRQREQEDYIQQLSDLRTQYNQERAARIEAFNQQLKDLSGFYSTQSELFKSFTDAQIAYLQSRVNALKAGATTSTVPSRDSGGYTWNGLFMMHDNEFVANRQTTHALEQLAGGKLTQASLLSLAFSGAGRGAGFTYNDYRRVNGPQPKETRRIVEQETLEILGKVLS